MVEAILGIFGGGALVQLVNYLTTLRQNRRQMNATALGAEVEALERTIMVLSSNFERQDELHRREVASLREEIELLRQSRNELQVEVDRLRECMSRMGLKE